MAHDRARGWYHSSSTDDAGEIRHFDEHPRELGWNGPFPSWSAARRDAIEYHMTSARMAKQALRQLRSMRREPG